MQLNIFERIILLNILPAEGNITTLKIVRKLRESLSFTEEEHKEYGIKFDEGRISWANNADREIEIGAKAKEIISAELKSLSEKGKLTERHIELYDKFIDET